MVELQRVSYSFGSYWALKDVSFKLGKGEFLFLTGHSGAGKTTLLRLLYGALPLNRGRGRVAEFELHRLRRSQVPDLRRKVSVVFQDFKVLPDRTVFQNVAMALEVRGLARNHLERRVRAIVRAMGLESKSYQRCERLSGGEQQRVAIARSMVANPKLILADEPTGNLDADLTRHLMDLFKQFHTYGTTVIMATHNKAILDTVPEAKRLHLEQGAVVEMSPSLSGKDEDIMARVDAELENARDLDADLDGDMDDLDLAFGSAFRDDFGEADSSDSGSDTVADTVGDDVGNDRRGGW